LSVWYSPVGASVIVKFGPGTLLSEGINFQLPFQGEDWWQPKIPSDTALASIHIFVLFTIWVFTGTP
jgi:hypothetical protein